MKCNKKNYFRFPKFTNNLCSYQYIFIITFLFVISSFKNNFCDCTSFNSINQNNVFLINKKPDESKIILENKNNKNLKNKNEIEIISKEKLTIKVKKENQFISSSHNPSNENSSLQNSNTTISTFISNSKNNNYLKITGKGKNCTNLVWDKIPIQ